MHGVAILVLKPAWGNITTLSIFSYLIKRILKKNFNKNGRKCRDVKTQKVCKQSQDGTNTQEEPKLNNHLQKTQQKYLQCYKAKDKQLYFCIGLYGSCLFNSLVLC